MPDLYGLVAGEPKGYAVSRHSHPNPPFLFQGLRLQRSGWNGRLPHGHGEVLHSEELEVALNEIDGAQTKPSEVRDLSVQLHEVSSIHEL
jgi:hypothetical protein